MGKISVRHRRDIETYVSRDRLPPERAAGFSDAELNSRMTRYYPNEGESLNFFQVEIEPNGLVAPHAHTAAEVIYVTAGELRLGTQVAVPGTAVFIDAETLYGFTAGPQGCTFLNFRGVPAVGFITKDELMAKRSRVPA